MLGESKVLSFFLVLIKEMKERGESKISLCYPGVQGLYLSLITSEVV